MLPIRTAIRGLKELDACEGGGFTHVVSILDGRAEHPPWPTSLRALPRLNLRFDDAVAAAAGTAMFAEADVDALTGFADLATEAAAPSVLLHCSYGMSRSTACAGIMHAHLASGLSGVQIFTEILNLRNSTWPNLHIIEIGDRRLGRDGDLIVGARAVYRHQLAMRPEWAQELTRVGRGREVQAAAGAAVIRL